MITLSESNIFKTCHYAYLYYSEHILKVLVLVLFDWLKETYEYSEKACLDDIYQLEFFKRNWHNCGWQFFWNWEKSLNIWFCNRVSVKSLLSYLPICWGSHGLQYLGCQSIFYKKRRMLSHHTHKRLRVNVKKIN